MTVAQVDLTQSLQEGLTTVVNIIPAILAFLAILIIGYIVARLLAKALDAVLERVGFDRAVERGGVARAMERTEYDASDILSRIVFYALMLFVLQLAFGVFGPNPVSDVISGVIGFLPRLFVAIIILVVAAAIAAGAREVVRASLGGLSYGHVVANLASVAILAVGVFAALNQLRIAPAIVNGLFYAVLAIIAGSAIVAIGGGGIVPMRRQWERAMSRVEEEAPRVRAEAGTPGDRERAGAEAGRERGNGGGARRHTSEGGGEAVTRPEDEETVRSQSEDIAPPGRQSRRR